MNGVIELTLENFQQVVVQGSMERPVVVYFWGEWAAPCKEMTPILNKLSSEMNFVLATVDAEKDQQIATYFRITNVPDIRIFSQGQMVDAIQGTLTETSLRKRLGKHFLSPADLALIEAETLLQQGNPTAALPLLDQLLAADPTSKKVLYSKAKALVDLDRSEEARTILSSFQEGDDFFREAKALGELMAFHQVCARPATSDPVEQAYRNACAQALRGDYHAALDGLLAIVATNPKWSEEAARKSMLTLFGVMGAKHELTWEYRAKLNSLLFV